MRKRTTVRGIDPRKTHTTARFIVERQFTEGRNRVPDAVVQVRALDTGSIVLEGKTLDSLLESDRKGTFETRLFRAGTYDVVVTADGSGPLPADGGAVREGPWKRRITFRPSDAFADGEVRNEVRVVISFRNPIIRVVAIDVTFDPRPIEGAQVEVIGVSLGQTNAEGRFSSEPVPFGKRGVRVSFPDMSPITQAGAEFFREVELREKGTLGVMPAGRDLELQVPLSRFGAVDLPGTHPRPIAVWVTGGATPHAVADDPSLPNPGAGDVPEGQDGWDLGLLHPLDKPWVKIGERLTGREILPDRLGGGPIGKSQVKRLAFVAHGAPGVCDVDQKQGGAFGVAEPAENTSLTLARLSLYERALDHIRDSLHEGGFLYFASCTMAEDRSGEELLRALSRRLPTIRVVGSRSILAIPTHGFNDKPKTGQMYAGLRDTPFRHGGVGATEMCNDLSKWNDLTALPWFSENSPHATVALDGNIIRRGNPPEAA